MSFASFIEGAFGSLCNHDGLESDANGYRFSREVK